MRRKSVGRPKGAIWGHLGARKGRFANNNRQKSQKIAMDFEVVLLIAKELCAVFAFWVYEKHSLFNFGAPSGKVHGTKVPREREDREREDRE